MIIGSHVSMSGKDMLLGSVKEAVSGDTTSAKPKKYYKERENKLKFTYAEQKEYDTIDDDIALLESKIEELDGDFDGDAVDDVDVVPLRKENG